MRNREGFYSLAEELEGRGRCTARRMSPATMPLSCLLDLFQEEGITGRTPCFVIVTDCCRRDNPGFSLSCFIAPVCATRLELRLELLCGSSPRPLGAAECEEPQWQ